MSENPKPIQMSELTGLQDSVRPFLEFLQGRAAEAKTAADESMSQLGEMFRQARGAEQDSDEALKLASSAPLPDVDPDQALVARTLGGISDVLSQGGKGDSGVEGHIQQRRTSMLAERQLQLQQMGEINKKLAARAEKLGDLELQLKHLTAAKKAQDAEAELNEQTSTMLRDAEKAKSDEKIAGERTKAGASTATDIDARQARRIQAAEDAAALKEMPMTSEINERAGEILKEIDNEKKKGVNKKGVKANLKTKLINARSWQLQVSRGEATAPDKWVRRIAQFNDDVNNLPLPRDGIIFLNESEAVRPFVTPFDLDEFMTSQWRLEQIKEEDPETWDLLQTAIRRFERKWETIDPEKKKSTTGPTSRK